MNNKGFLGEIGLIIAIMLLVSVVVIVGYKTFTSYNEKWQDLPVDQGAKDLVQDNKDRYVSLFDGIFMFVFAMLCIALFASVVVIDTKPAFFFITIIVLAFMIGGGAMVSNAYEDISTSNQLNNTSSEFTFIPFIMSELPKVVLMLGFLVIAGLYMKMKGIL